MKDLRLHKLQDLNTTYNLLTKFHAGNQSPPVYQLLDMYEVTT